MNMERMVTGMNGQKPTNQQVKQKPDQSNPISVVNQALNKSKEAQPQMKKK